MSNAPVGTVKIGASLLAADLACLRQEVRRVERAGVDSLHLDIMDGQYVRNLALAPHHIKALKLHTNLPFSAHLELENPNWILEAFDPLGAETIIVQADICLQPSETFARIRSQGAKVGLALNPGDPLRSVRHLVVDIDLLLIMAVQPGFGGQAPHPRTAFKTTAARELVEREGLHLLIGVDGGIKPGNAGELIRAGANLLVVGTALFQAADTEATVRAMKGICQS